MSKSKKTPQDLKTALEQNISRSALTQAQKSMGLSALEPRILLDAAAVVTGAEAIADNLLQDQTEAALGRLMGHEASDNSPRFDITEHDLDLSFEDIRALSPTALNEAGVKPDAPQYDLLVEDDFHTIKGGDIKNSQDVFSTIKSQAAPDSRDLNTIKPSPPSDGLLVHVNNVFDPNIEPQDALPLSGQQTDSEDLSDQDIFARFRLDLDNSANYETMSLLNSPQVIGGDLTLDGGSLNARGPVDIFDPNLPVTTDNGNPPASPNDEGFEGHRLDLDRSSQIEATAPPAPQNAASDTLNFTNGEFRVFVSGNNTDGSGFQDNGFAETITALGGTLTVLDNGNEFDVTGASGDGSADVSTVSFQNGSARFSSSFTTTDRAEFRTTTASNFFTGDSGEGIFIDPEQGGTAGDFYDVIIDFDTPVNAFSLDLVDIFDTIITGQGNTATPVLRYEVIADGEVLAVLRSPLLGDDNTGVIEVLDAEGNVQGTIIAGQNLENTIGFVTMNTVDNVTIRHIIESGTILSTARDPHGIDNIAFSTDISANDPPAVDTDGDGVNDDVDVDDDNDGILDVNEGLRVVDGFTIGEAVLTENGDGSGSFDIPVFDSLGQEIGSLELNYTGFTGDGSTNGSNGTNPNSFFTPILNVGLVDNNIAFQLIYSLPNVNNHNFSYTVTSSGLDFTGAEHNVQGQALQGGGPPGRVESGRYTLVHTLSDDPIALTAGGSAHTVGGVGVALGADLADGTEILRNSGRNANRQFNVGFDLLSGETYGVNALLNNGRAEGIENTTFVFSAFVSAQADSDFDGDGIANQLDIDSDNDGITDNIEAQSTNGFIAPSGRAGTADFIDLNRDGLDDNYDDRTVTAATSAASAGAGNGAGLSPVDTDSDGDADYLDINSDNEGGNDTVESGLGSDIATGLSNSGTDADGDGLFDIFDAQNGTDANDGFNVNESIATGAAALPDADNDANGGVPLSEDVDFRDSVTTNETPTIDLDVLNDPTIEPDANSGFTPLNISAPIDIITDANGNTVSATYSGVAVVNGVTIDLIATLNSLEIIEPSTGSNPVSEFRFGTTPFTTDQNDPNFGLLNANNTIPGDFGRANVTYRLVNQETGNPVPLTFTVIFGDFDGNASTGNAERIIVNTADIDAFILEDGAGSANDDGTPGTDILLSQSEINGETFLTFAGGDNDPTPRIEDTGNAVQLVFSNTSEFTVTLERDNSGRNIGFNAQVANIFGTPVIEDTNANFENVFIEGSDPVNVAAQSADVDDIMEGDINLLTIMPGNIADGDAEILNFNGDNNSTVSLALDGSDTDQQALVIGGTDVFIQYDNGVINITAQDGGVIPQGDLDALIRAITYENISTEPSEGAGSDRTLTFNVTDSGGLVSNDAVSTITVIGVEANPPILDLNSAASLEDTDRDFSAEFIAGSDAVTIVDIDGDALDGEQINGFSELRITPTSALPDGADEILQIAGVDIPLNADITHSGVVLAGVSTVFDITYRDGVISVREVGGGIISNADFDALLRSAAYRNLAATPSDAAARTFDFQAVQFDPSRVVIDFEELTPGTQATAEQIGSDPYWASAAAQNGQIQDADNAGPFNQTLANNADGTYLFHNTGGNVPNDQRIIFGRDNIPVEANQDYTVSLDIGRQNRFSAGPFEVLINGQSIGIIDVNSGPIQDWQTLTFNFNSGDASEINFQLRNTSVNGTGNDFGIDNIIFERDPLILSNIATSTVNIIANVAPDAQDDSFSINENPEAGTSEVGVITNGDLFADNGSGIDSDVNNDPLTITQINGEDITGGEVITLTSGALLTIRTDGSFDYDPNGAFDSLDTGEMATDSFVYTLSDGTATDTAVVTITIDGDNDTPIIDLNGAADGTDFADVFVEDQPGQPLANLLSFDAVVQDDEDNIAQVTIIPSLPIVNDGAAEFLRIDSSGIDLSIRLSDGEVIANTPLIFGDTTFDVAVIGGEIIITNADGGTFNSDDLEGFLRLLAYQNTDQNNTPGARAFEFQVIDPAGVTVATSAITVNRVNDAPEPVINPATSNGTVAEVGSGAETVPIAVVNPDTAASVAALTGDDVREAIVGGASAADLGLISVAELLAQLEITDAEQAEFAIGVIFADESQGRFQYVRTGDGFEDHEFTDFQLGDPDNLDPTPVPDGEALLLAADTYIRFLADPGFLESAALIFRISDLSVGTPSNPPSTVVDDSGGVAPTNTSSLSSSAFMVDIAADTDGDGIINAEDIDSDNDGILDVVEAGLVPTPGILGQADAFDEGPGFYQIINNGTIDGEAIQPGQLFSFNPLTDSYVPIGDPIGFDINATGYDPDTDFIYGLAQTDGVDAAGNIVLADDLIKIDRDGEAFRIGRPSANINAQIAGTIFDGMLVVRSGGTQISFLDISGSVGSMDDPVTLTFNLTESVGGEFLIIDSILYQIPNNTTGTFLQSVDLTGVMDGDTLTVNQAQIFGDFPAASSLGLFGAGWTATNPVTGEQELFFSRNNTGEIFRINDFDTANPTAEFFLQGVSTGSNDGAGPPDQAPPTLDNLPDTDGDGIPDFLDIDSDDDGITDTIEAQTTAGFIAPSGTGNPDNGGTFVDVNRDGLDDNFDAGLIAGGPANGIGLTPVDTDGLGLADFIDPDSDDDGILDIDENGLGVTFVAGDVDGDGLADVFELAIDGNANDGFIVTENIDDLFNAPNGFLPDAGGDASIGMPIPLVNDLDFRDVNDDPVATNDGLGNTVFTVSEDRIVNITAANGVIANDNDPDGDSLTVTRVATGIDTLILNSLVNGTGVGAAIAGSNGGQITVNTDGSITFDPNGDFDSLQIGESAVTSLVYQIDDGNGGTDTGIITFTVNGVNDAPVAQDDNEIVNEDAVLSDTVLLDNGNGVDSDIDGDTLNVTAVNGQAADVGQQIILASGALLTLNADGRYEYDPNGQFDDLANGETALDSFTYEVSDGNGGADTATVNITINGVNTAPTLDSDGDNNNDPNDNGGFETVYTENQIGATFIVDSDVTISDAEDNIVEARITLTGLAGDQLGIDSSILNPLGISTSIIGGGTTILAADGSLTIVLTSASPLTNEQWEQALRAVQFIADSDTPERPVEAARQIDITLVDEDGGASPSVQTVINVTEINDVPDLDLDDGNTGGINAGNYQANFTEGNGPIGVTADVVINDLDDTDLVEAVVTFDNPQAQDQLFVNGVLVYDNGVLIETAGAVNGTLYTVQIDMTGRAIITFSGEASLSDYESFFEAISFNNNSETPDETVREFGFVIMDRENISSERRAMISIMPVNSGPNAQGNNVNTDADSLLSGNVITDIDPVNGADSDPEGDSLNVIEVDGVPASVDTQVMLASGALLTVNVDGSYDYDPNGVFDSLAVGETAVDSFSYTVSDGNGGTDIAVVNISINGVNDAPQTIAPANPGDPVIPNQTGSDGESFTPLDLTPFFTDPDISDVLTLNIAAADLPSGLSFDPATGLITGTPSADASQGGPNGDGVYIITVTADDGNGGAVMTDVQITISNPGPAAEDDGFTTTEDTAAISGNVITGDNGNGADSDPDGDSLAVTQVNGDAANIGQAIAGTNGGLFTINSDGSVSFETNGEFDSLDVGESLTTEITYQVSDGEGGFDTATLTVTVTGENDAPMVIDPNDPNNPNPSVPNQSGTDNAPLTPLDASNYFTDVDGEVNLFALEGAPSWLEIDLFTGVITGTPPSDASQGGPNGDGTYPVTLLVTDFDGAETRVTINFVIGNLAPDAQNDNLSAHEDGPVISGSLFADNGNGMDSDPDGDDITVSAVNGQAGNIGQTIAGDNGGLFTVNADGSYSFDANGDFEGLDAGETAVTTLSYTISDGNGGFDTALVSVTINGANDAPELVDPNDPNNPNPDAASLIPAQSGDDSEPITPLDVSPFFTDVDDEPLNFSLSNAPSWLSIDPLTGEITGTPPADASQGGVNGDGEYVITVTAQDPDGESISAEVSFTISNPAPTAQDDSLATSEDAVLSGSLLADNGSGADVDPDGDVITISEVNGIALVSGAAMTLPSGAIVTVNADGSYDYDPNGQFEGLDAGETALDSFTYQISDGEGGFDTAVVTITIEGVNDAPNVDGSVLAAQMGRDSEPVTPLDTSLAFDDIDGEDLTFTADNLPDGLMIDPDTGIITGTPPSDASQGGPNGDGVYVVTITATDPDGAMVTTTVVYNIANPAPVVDAAVADSSVVDGEAVMITPSISDPDGDDLTYSVSGLPSGLSIDPVTGEITGVVDNSASQGGPNGDGVYTVTITADDGEGGVITDTFEITVSNPVPTAEDDANTASENTPVNGNVLDNDTDPDGDDLIVSQVNGDEANIGQPVGGDNGGSFTLNADGSYSFDPGADFEGLDVGETATTMITYQVSDGEGGFDMATLTVTVTGENDAPTVAMLPPGQSGEDGQPITPLDTAPFFDDIDGEVLSFTADGLPSGLMIDPDTGIITGTPSGDASQGGANSDGVYTVTITATDPDGQMVTTTLTYTVTNPAPVVDTAVADSSVVDGEAVTITPSISDPDGDDLTYSVSGLPDGLSIDPMTGEITGVVDNSASQGGPNGDGVYTVTITADDGEGGVITDTFEITVSNPVPIAANDVISTPEDTPVTVNVLSNDTDPDNDGMSVIDTAALPDGTLIPIGIPTVIAEGILTVNADGRVEFEPAPNFNGPLTFGYTLSDGEGGVDVATVTINVTPVNDAPIPIDPSQPAVDPDTHPQPTDPDNPRVAPFDPNDFIPAQEGEDGAPQAPFDLTPYFGDPDAEDDVSVSVDPSTLPPGLSFDGTSLVGTLDPAASQGGPNGDGVYVIAVTATDESGASFTTFVTYRIANPAPVVDMPIGSHEALDNGIVSITPSITDPDGDELTYSVDGLPSGLVIDPVTGEISGVVDNSASQGGPNGDGVYTVTLTADDGEGGVVTDVFIISVSNPAPIAVDDGPITVIEDTPVVIDLLGNDTDPDGDDLVITDINGTPVNPGDVIALPSGGEIIVNSDGSVTYTPLENSNEPDSFTYTVSDGEGGSDTASVDIVITPVNDAPSLNGVALEPRVNIDGEYIDPVNVSGPFEDVDRDVLVFSADNLPPGLMIDPVTGIISGTLDGSASVDGPYEVVITATDPDGESISVSFIWTVDNVPPVVIAPLAPQDFTTADEVNISVADIINDADGDDLTFTADNLPAGLSIDPAAGIITGTAQEEGVFTVVITIDDGEGGQVQTSLTLDVLQNGFIIPDNGFGVNAKDALLETADKTPLLEALDGVGDVPIVLRDFFAERSIMRELFEPIDRRVGLSAGLLAPYLGDALAVKVPGIDHDCGYLVMETLGKDHVITVQFTSALETFCGVAVTSLDVTLGNGRSLPDWVERTGHVLHVQPQPGQDSLQLRIRAVLDNGRTVVMNGEIDLGTAQITETSRASASLSSFSDQLLGEVLELSPQQDELVKALA